MEVPTFTTGAIDAAPVAIGAQLLLSGEQQLSGQQLLLSGGQQQLSEDQLLPSGQQLHLSWQQQQLSKKLQLPKIAVSLDSPWQVRMNLATYRWPTRWFSDASWALCDGIIIAIVALWVSWRLLLRSRNSDEKRFSKSVIFVSLLSIVCYAGYIIDDKSSHNVHINHYQYGSVKILRSWR